MSHSRYVHLRAYFHFLPVGRVIESQQLPTMLRMTPRLLARSYVPLEGPVPSLQSQVEYYRDNEAGQPETAILKVWRGSGWQQWPPTTRPSSVEKQRTAWFICPISPSQ